MESPELTVVSPRPEPCAGASADRLDHSAPADVANNDAESFHINPTISYIPGQQHEKDTADAETIGVAVPDGGRRAWLVVLGGFLDFAIAFGLLASFDSFQADAEANVKTKRSTTEVSTPALTLKFDWVGRVQLMVLAASAIIIGPAFVAFGARRLMLSGTFFCLVSFICTSFATKLSHYLVSQGFLLGIGSALVLYPALGAISGWFDNKRALALGIAVSGAALGLAVWPIIFQKLLSVIDGPWLHRVVAVICVPFLLLTCLLVRERKGVAGLHC